MKRAKQINKQFPVHINTESLHLIGVFNANHAVRIKTNPYQIFKPCSPLSFKA